MIKKYWQKGGKQKRVVIITGFILLLLLFFLRDDYQPALLFLRKYVFLILLGILFLWFTISKFRSALTAGKRILILLGIVAFFVAGWFIGWKIELYQFMQTYNVYRNLNLVEIHELPLTQNERIQPYNNIVTMAYESIGETQEVSMPQLVRVDSSNQWTMAVQPAKEYIWQRINDNTEELFTVESTSPFPRFSDKHRVPVTFAIGESLAFSRNTYNAVVQRFNFFELFTMEPSEVFYMKDDSGKWVQVVSLIKWKGFFFPYPAYGGVMVIDAGNMILVTIWNVLVLEKGLIFRLQRLKTTLFSPSRIPLMKKSPDYRRNRFNFLGALPIPYPGIWKQR